MRSKWRRRRRRRQMIRPSGPSIGISICVKLLRVLESPESNEWFPQIQHNKRRCCVQVVVCFCFRRCLSSSYVQWVPKLSLDEIKKKHFNFFCGTVKMMGSSIFSVGQENE